MNNRDKLGLNGRLSGLGLWLRFIVCLCLASNVHAIEVAGLYDVDIPVADQSRESRQEAFKQALERVMIRISGNPGIVQVEGVDKVMSLASHYVRKFQYRAIDEQDEALISTELQNAQAKVATKILAIEFDGESIQNRLREMRVTTWGLNRPPVLLWVAVEQNRQRQIISESSSTTIRKMLDQAAKRRGVPLIYPLMDLEDRSKIEFGDIRGNFPPSIRAASGRYDADIVLAGYVRQDSTGEWVAEWTVYRNNVSSGWVVRDRLAPVISSAIDGVTDILVSRYGALSSQQDTRYELILQVDEIVTMDDYAKSFKYLSSLSVVETVQPLSINANIVRFKVQIRGAPRYLERAIALENILQPSTEINSGSTGLNTSSFPVMIGAGESRADLYYRFQ